MSAEENPAYVLDASVILKWVLDSEDEPGRPEAASLLERWKRGEIELFVPSLWIYEVGNILALKRPEDKSVSLLALLDLGLREIALDRRLATRTTELAHSYGLTFYDASYLAVAESRSGILITADAKLLRRLPEGAPAGALVPAADEPSPS